MIDPEPQGERGQVKDHGSIKDRRHSPPWTWVLVGSLIVQFMLMTVAITVGAVITRDIRKASNRAAVAAVKANTATGRLDDAVRGGCVRNQLERERSNVAEATIFLVLKAASAGATDTNSRRVFRDQAAATAWSPPADCTRATEDPAHYKPPRQIPFSRLPASYPSRIVAAAKHQRPQPLP